LFGAGAAVEQFALKRFQKNADKASKGLLWILEKFREVNKIKGYY
jgi:hypothetical protein